MASRGVLSSRPGVSRPHGLPAMRGASIIRGAPVLSHARIIMKTAQCGLCLALLIGGVAEARGQVDLKATIDPELYAEYNHTHRSRTTVRDRLPGGTPILTTRSVRAGFNGPSFFARIETTRTVRPNDVEYSWRSSTYSDYDFDGLARGGVSLVIHSPKPVFGRLTIDYVYATTSPRYRATASCRIDSSAFPTILLSKQNHQREIPLVVDSGGVSIKHTVASASLHTFSYATAEVRLSIRFVADTSLEEYGTSCGPRLSGAVGVNRALMIHAEGLVPRNGVAGLLLGLQPAAVRIPGTACFLNTQFLLAVPITADTRGRATLTVPRPAASDVRVQAITVDTTTGRMQLSNGLWIRTF